MNKYIWNFLLTASALTGLSSCMYDKPDPNCTIGFQLKVQVDTDWLPQYDMTLSRAENEPDLVLKYQFQAYDAAGNLYRSFEVTRSDLDFNDFYVDVALHPADYTIYAWCDYCDATTGQPLFYNSSDFNKISLLTPYQGNSEYKDAFRGQASVNPIVPESHVINLSRPLAKYQLLSTGLEKFENLSQILNDYTIKVSYPLFVPSVFNNFTNKPVDSLTGENFEGQLEITSDNLAILASDFILTNGADSNVQVSVEVYDADGNLVGNTPVFDIPLLRDRTTIVTGDFLTVSGNGNVVIDPEFNGQYNIEYK